MNRPLLSLARHAMGSPHTSVKRPLARSKHRLPPLSSAVFPSSPVFARSASSTVEAPSFIPISIDRSSLLGSGKGSQQSASDATPKLSKAGKFEKETPLATLLKAMILARGPLSVADFMRTCLSHPQFGYYMHTEHSVFGSKGDFITSPEISQLFGELVGVWLVATWQSLGCPRRVALVECGPGKGTLMADVLKVAKKFPAFYEAIIRVDLVETSRHLRRVQADTLGLFLIEKETRWYDRVEDIGSATAAAEEDGGDVHTPHGKTARKKGSPMARNDDDKSAAGAEGQQMREQEEDTAVPLLLAHELFDALPVHQLSWSKEASAWRERLVQVDPEAEVETSTGTMEGGEEPFPHFDIVVAPSATPASAGFTATVAAARLASGAGTGTQHGLQEAFLQEGSVCEYSPACLSVASSMAKRIARTGGACLIFDYGYSVRCGSSNASALPASSAKPSSASAFLSSLPALPADPRGMKPTVRGIRQHRFVDMLSTPGEADLSADVDFDALARAAIESVAQDKEHEEEAETSRLSVGSPASSPSPSSSPATSLDAQIEAMVATARLSSGGRSAAAQAAQATPVPSPSPSATTATTTTISPVAVAGPVSQGEFLMRMGIGARLERLLKKVDEQSGDPAVKEETKARLYGEAKRLAGMDDGQGEMGSIYKVMALLSPVPSSSSSPEGRAERKRESDAWKLAAAIPGF